MFSAIISALSESQSRIGEDMSESGNLNKSGSGRVYVHEGKEYELDKHGNLILPEDFERGKEPRGKKFIYAVTALSAVILLFALVVVFYAVQAMDDSRSDEAYSAEAIVDDVEAAYGVDVTESDIADGILVALETDYIHYNANLDEDMRPIDPTAGLPAQWPEDDELVFPPPDFDDITFTQVGTTPPTPPPAANQGLGTNYANIIGIDVLDAQARARAAGYVVHQVFVVCPNVVNNNASPPRPGEVLEVQTFTMRGDGQRYMFLHVMTTEPPANARTVPNLVGVQWETGRDRLRGVGLGARYVYERNSNDPKGRVIFQAPQAGRFTPAGSTVIMVLAD